jgi:phosphopantothenoylcysteine decarboxylase/phosphopantothenate--cysteine ligase
VSLATPAGVRRVDVQTAREMHAAVMQTVSAEKPDVFVAVAAVADWRVANPAAQKIKKQAGRTAPALSFAENPDILAEVAALADGPWCVGFAAESENLDASGEAKRKRKGIDLLVGNIGPRTFGRDDNELVLFDARGRTKIARADKLTLARGLVAEISTRLAARAGKVAERPNAGRARGKAK